MAHELIKPTDLRQTLADRVRSVAVSKRPLDIGSRRPRYRLTTPGGVPDQVRRTLVEIGVDEARKNFHSVRFLIDLEDDLAFGIVMGGRLMAVLCRHPKAKRIAAVRYREAWRKSCKRPAR